MTQKLRDIHDAMTPAERMRIAGLWFAWAQEYLATGVRRDFGELPPEVMKCYVALRMYGHELEVRKLIERHLCDVLDLDDGSDF